LKDKKTLKLVNSALFAALIFAGTLFIKVPLPFGYFNLGDCFIILSAVFIGGSYSVASAAIGSVMADILSGYTIYAPATLVIKSVMAIVLTAIYHSNRLKSRPKVAVLAIGAAISELIMSCGYFLYDSILYGIAGAVATLFGNFMQALCSAVAGVLLISAINRIKRINQ
jgi:uncharacterized membrane protein